MIGMAEEVEGHILRHYDMKKRIGKGAYGIVWKAVDRRNGEICALKKIWDAFRNTTDAQRTYREVYFLTRFSSHQNVIQLLNVVRADNDRDLYLVFEYMDTDLHQAIRVGILADVHRAYIMYQLLSATSYLHSGNVIHRDYKPSNVLLNAECFVKVADFGLARSLCQIPPSHHGNHSEVSTMNSEPLMTEYVATRWYRAPEILLSSSKYTKGVDMWSLGCILGEMLSLQPLFPGSSSLNMISLISSALPPPTHDDVISLQSPYAQSTLEHARGKRKLLLADKFPDVSPQALDLLSQLVRWNPEKRVPAREALSLPYVSQFYDGHELVDIQGDVVPDIIDDVILSVSEYREKLYSDIKLANENRTDKRAKSLETFPTHSIAATPSLSNTGTLRNVGDRKEDLFSLKSTPVLLRGSYSPKLAPKPPPPAGKPTGPSRISLSPAVCGYVRVSVFTKSAEFLTTFTHELMKEPGGISIHRNNVYVTDARVGMFHFKIHAGIRFIARQMGRGSAEGKFRLPRQLTVSADGDVYIADYYNDRIQILDDALNFERSITHESMSCPVDVQLTNTEVYVLSLMDSPCVHVFSHDGEKYALLNYSWCKNANSVFFFCLDAQDNIQVLISGCNAGLKVCYQGGTLIHTIGIRHPYGVALTKPRT